MPICIELKFQKDWLTGKTVKSYWLNKVSSTDGPTRWFQYTPPLTSIKWPFLSQKQLYIGESVFLIASKYIIVLSPENTLWQMGSDGLMNRVDEYYSEHFVKGNKTLKYLYRLRHVSTHMSWMHIYTDINIIKC